MTQQPLPGWYPEDPNDPARLRFWDGQQWTDQRTGPAGPAPGRSGSWWTSWPVIALGFLLCLVPGLVLLWLRPGTSKWVKGGASAAVAGIVILAGTTSPPADTPAAAPTSPAVPSATPTAAQSSTTAPATAAPTASPSATPSPTEPASSPAAGSAAEAAAALPVKGRAPKTGYERAQFGTGWIDVDRNGCDTRNDMLKAVLTGLEMSGSCKVLSGVLNPDPYTGQVITFIRGGASEVDIDHLVPLSDAWQKGAQRWPFAKRVAFANDPLNLQPSDASANRQKGDGDAATWLPPNQSYRCEYVARQIAVKKKYQLWVTAAERDAMLRVLEDCPGQELPDPGPQPTIAANTGGQDPGKATATPKPAPKPTKTVKLDPQFNTCTAAIDAGYGPYYRGEDPEYDWYEDRDNDGVVCER